MPAGDPPDPQRRPPELYEPLPDLAALPGWLWRKTSRRARIAAAVGVLGLIAAAVALAPGIREAQRERAEAERRERAARRAQVAQSLQGEQRPRFGRSEAVAPAGASRERRLSARADLVAEVAATVVADARRRERAGQLDGPILRAQCEPFPRTVGGVPPEDDLSRRFGRYSCLVVTSEFGRSPNGIRGLIGHTYRTRIDFRTGRYAFCKIAGRPGPERSPVVTTPRPCGG